jgi:hypothetical protein
MPDAANTVGHEEDRSIYTEEQYDAEADTADAIITGKADSHDLIWAKSEFEKSCFTPDVIYPISHVLLEYIAPIGSCEFLLQGFYGAKLAGESKLYTAYNIMINSIEIRSMDGSFYQLIEGLSTQLKPYEDNYGFDFGDWNGDGIIDLKLQQFIGGTMRNEPSLFWLWDDDPFMFVENKELREISDFSTVYLEPEKDHRIRSYQRADAGEYGIAYYEYQDGNFVCVESKYVFTETEDDIYYEITQISKLIDGEMKIVEESKMKYEDR